MEDFVRRTLRETKAEHLRVASGDCGDLNWGRGGVHLQLLTGTSVLIFKVEPIVTVLQAENMIWPFVCISCSNNAEFEIDQSTLYREEAREMCLSVRHSNNRNEEEEGHKGGHTDLRTSVLECAA